MTRREHGLILHRREDAERVLAGHVARGEYCGKARLGSANCVEIAEREAPLLGLTQPECLAYLRDNLYFYLGPRERSGLAMFHQLAQQMNLAPPGVDVGSLHLEGSS